MDMTWRGRTLSSPWRCPLLFGLRSLKDRWPFLSLAGHHPKSRLRSSGSKGCSLTILAFSRPDMNGCDNLSPEQSASGHEVNSLALCPRRIDLLFIIIFFLACLRSFYPGNKSILKEMVLSWCDAFLVCFLCIRCKECYMTAVLIMLHFLCITIQIQALKWSSWNHSALFLSCFLQSK